MSRRGDGGTRVKLLQHVTAAELSGARSAREWSRADGLASRFPLLSQKEYNLGTMHQDRRTFLVRGAATATAVALDASRAAAGQAAGANDARARNRSGLEEDILALFTDLPDRKAIKVWAPATSSDPEVLVELNSGKRMFVASTLK